MGNGKLIDIEKDPWISQVGKLSPYVTNDNLKGLRVSYLLDENNRWKEDLIHQNFTSQDAIDILNMPTGDKNSRDEISWFPNKKDTFTVKSAYHLAKDNNNRLEASHSDRIKSSLFWKSIWSLKTLPRSKVCV